MAKAVAILSSIFWGAGVIGTIGGVDVLQSTLRRFGIGYHLVVPCILLLIALLSLPAAYGMTFGKPWARRWGIMASIPWLLVPPIGLFGLIVLLNGKSRQILDEQASARDAEIRSGRSRNTVVAALVSVAAAVGGVWWMATLQLKHGAPFAPWYGYVAVLLFSNTVVVLVHELGHFLAGWLVHFELKFLSVGRVALRNVDGRWRMEWKGVVGWKGGLAGAVPARAGDIRKRLMIYTAGGPLASLSLALVGAAAFLATLDGRWTATSIYWGALAVFSFPAFAGSLTPSWSKGYASDGALLWSLWKGGRDAKREIAIASCLVSAAAKDPVSDWDPEWVRALTAVSDNSMRHVLGCYLTYVYCLDRAQEEEAGRWLDEAVKLRNESKAGLRAAISAYACEAAYYAGRFRNDPAEARRWIEAADKSDRTAVYCLAHAAVEGVEGNFVESGVWIEQGRDRLAQHPRVTGFTLFDQSRLDDLDSYLTTASLVPEEIDTFVESPD